MSKAAISDVSRPPGDWSRIVLRGVGQVMFQEHAGTGILFLVGIAIASFEMCLAAILGAVVGTFSAVLMRIDREQISAGLYGFNSALVGIALLFYLKPCIVTWLLVVGGAALATLVAWTCRRGLPFPVYTAPFVVVAWGCLALADGFSMDLRRPPVEPNHTPTSFLSSVLAGEAEVMFGAGAATGACFLIGIALSNFQHALVAFAGSAIGTLAATYRHDPEASIWIGLYGYNASLAAMAAFLARPGLVAPALAAIVTVPIVDWAAAAWGVPALTAPFVLAAWGVLLLFAVERGLARTACEPS